MGVSQGKSTSEHFNSYFKDEDDEDEEKSEKDENEIITKNINIHESINDDINKLNEEMTFIKNQLIDFNKSFIESQRQLNLMIKDSITEQKQNNLSRESSSSNLFKVFTRSRRNSTSSKGSNGSNGSKDGRKSFDVEYKEFGSKSFKLDSNSLSKLNESQNNNDNNDINMLPKFTFMPEFLKILSKTIPSIENTIFFGKFRKFYFFCKK